MHPSRVALSPQKPDSTERNYFLGLNNKALQPGWFKLQTFFSSTVWRLEVLDQGIHRVGFF